MSTKLRSKADAPLPLALTTPFMSNIDTNGIRPRLRRRIPSIQSMNAVSTPSKSRRSAGEHHVKKPSSAGSTHSNSSVKSSVSARSIVSAKSSSSTSGQSAASATLPNGTDLNELLDYDDDSEIKFINVPSLKDTGDPPKIPTKQLRDIVPDEILSQAQESEGSRVYQIDLHGAHIGQISNLEKFPRLRVLDLSCNHIKCIENLYPCTDIRELKLYDNAITEIKNLDSLQELSYLQLQHNRIRSLGRGLNQLKKLQVLRLDSNCLLKIESRELASCANLTSIDISNNKLDSLTALSCLPNLEELHAVNNRLRSVTDLSRCKKLQEIDISYNRLTDISGLRGLPHLKSLHLAHNLLANLKSLTKARNLEELNLMNNRLTDVAHLVTFYPAVQILDISENQIGDWEQVASLKGLSDLVELYIAGNPFSDGHGAKPSYHSDLQKDLPRLEILDGAHVKRQASRTTTPLMRPMSAATVVTSRQVENQLQSMVSDIADFENTVSSKFESLRSDMKDLPIEPPSRPASGRSLLLSTPGTSRPSSKSGKRSRLQEAKAFAENHFDDVYQ